MSRIAHLDLNIFADGRDLTDDIVVLYGEAR